MPYMPYSKMYMPYSKNKNDILTCPTVTKKISLHALQQKKKISLIALLCPTFPTVHTK
jgi:hypothetical protein